MNDQISVNESARDKRGTRGRESERFHKLREPERHCGFSRATGHRANHRYRRQVQHQPCRRDKCFARASPFANGRFADFGGATYARFTSRFRVAIQRFAE